MDDRSAFSAFWCLFVCSSAILIANNVSPLPPEAEVTEIINKFKHIRLRECEPQFPPWVYKDDFGTERYYLLQYEIGLENLCNFKGADSFVFTGDYRLPTKCESLTICNSTFCLSYGEEASAFLYSNSRNCDTKTWMTAFFNVKLQTGQHNPAFFTKTTLDMYETLMFSRRSDAVHFFSQVKSDIKFTSDAFKPVHDYVTKNCGSNKRKYLFLEGNGILPTECSIVKFCNSVMCFTIPYVSNLYATLYHRNEEPEFLTMALPGACTVIKQSPRTKTVRAIRPVLAINNQSSNGILNFNLPGFRYCGPGTDVEKMDDLGGPVNELDNLCRNHDIDYMIGVKPEDADERLLKEMFNLRHPFFPLFVATFEAKRYYEGMFGSEYTTSLYYFAENQTSLTYILSDRSVYDVSLRDTTAVQQGRLLEMKWKKLLHEIWSGFCYAQSLPAPSDGGNGGDKQVSGGVQSNVQESRPSTSQHSESQQSSESSNTDETVVSPTEEMFPENPVVNGKGCRLVISEIGHKGENVPSFLELHRICLSTRAKPKGLRGFHLLVVRIGDPSTIYMSINLDHYQMRMVSEKPEGAKTERTNLFFVVGDPAVSPDVTFKNQQIATPADGILGLPTDESSTFAAILLYSPSNPVASTNQLVLRMLHVGNHIIETRMSEPQRDVIKTYIQDIILYGAPCLMDICEEFLNLIPTSPRVQPAGGFYVPLPYAEQTSEPPFKSVSRCAENNWPMQNDRFLECFATPGKLNDCPKPPQKKDHIFSMQGTALQSSAQKLLINAHNYFQNYALNPIKLVGSPVELTSKVTSVAPFTIRRVLENCRTDNIQTPGKKRRNPFRKQGLVDGYLIDVIKNIIQGFYIENKAPLLSDIFEEFKRRVTLEEDAKRHLGEVVTPFTCAQSTFRKIIGRIGFKFGRINTSDGVLMRSDIVQWRWRYLTALRENARSENPKRVIYLDETWIDPHARTGKSWVPARCTNYRERSKYSFKRHKASRGPRIIVLNAGGAEGMMHGAMEVFAVKKKDVSGDYHDNVSAVSYIEWFKKLLAELEKTGHKYIIVQDNAPYHGTTSVPKQRDRKQVMYDWLAANLPAELKATLQPVKQCRKPKLWDLVKQQKKTRNFYVIDNLAEAVGHRVLRCGEDKSILERLRLFLFSLFFKFAFIPSLPPWNCDLNPIEFVWKDVKTEVKKGNADQTLDTVIELAKQVMLNYPVEKWQKHVAHVERLGDEYWKSDGFYETYLENNYSMIIDIDDENDDEDDDENNVVPIDPTIMTSSVHDEFSLDDDMEDELLDV